MVRGHARIQEGGAPELLQRLAHVYLGPDVKFPPMDDPPPGYVIRTTPERIGGVGPWAEPRLDLDAVPIVRAREHLQRHPADRA